MHYNFLKNKKIKINNNINKKITHAKKMTLNINSRMNDCKQIKEENS